MNKLLLFCLLLVPVSAFGQNNIKRETEDHCAKWISEVDSSVKYHKEKTTSPKTTAEENLFSLRESWLGFLTKPPVSGFLPDTTFSEKQVMEAISCLLKCKGNKNPASISGVTSIYVSQIYPSATVEIAALFYISYLYKANYTHAMGVALWKDKKFNPPGAVEIAYEYYERWFEKVKEIGLANARKLKLEPLEASEVSWY